MVRFFSTVKSFVTFTSISFLAPLFVALMAAYISKEEERGQIDGLLSKLPSLAEIGDVVQPVLSSAVFLTVVPAFFLVLVLRSIGPYRITILGNNPAVVVAPIFSLIHSWKRRESCFRVIGQVSEKFRKPSGD